MTNLVDEGRAADVVYLDVSTAFKTISHKSLIDTQMKYKLDKQTVRWTENWLKCQAQRAVTGSTKSRWRPGTNRVPQRPILLDTYISDLDNRIESNLSKTVDNTKLRGVAEAADGCTAIQRNLNCLEKWATKSTKEFNNTQIPACREE